MMKDRSIEELGRMTDLLMRVGRLDDAQKCVDEIQVRINNLRTAVNEVNELLAGLPMKEVTRHESPPLEPAGATEEKLESGMRCQMIEQAWEADGNEVLPPPTPEAEADAIGAAKALEEEGVIWDDNGKILAISVQIGNRGYDPEAYKKQIRIFCDGQHIESAHTADVEAGVVKYYKKNDKGRMKTLEMVGEVEIKAHMPDGQVKID